MVSLNNCNLLLTLCTYIVTGISDGHEHFFTVKIDIAVYSISEIWDFCLIQIPLCYAGLLKGEYLGTLIPIELFRQTL